MQQIIVIFIQLCQLILVTSAQDRSFHSTNTTASYNHASGTYDVAPNESFSIGCTYINLPAAVAYGEVSWRVGPYGEYPPHKLVTKGVIQSDPVVKEVNPLRVPKSEDHPLANGTMWLTLYQASKELYTADNPALTYQCELVALNGTTIASSQQLDYKTTVNISVVEAATIVRINTNTSSSQAITEGDDVALECVVEGLPTPTVTWTREDGKALVGSENGGLQHRGNIVQLININEAAAATYICSATNRVTRVAPTKPIRISVQHKPVLKVHSQIVYQMVGYHTELKCSVQSSNPDSLTAVWYQKPADKTFGDSSSQVIADDDRLLVSNLTVDRSSTLIIEPVVKEDYARHYCCVISNDVGPSHSCIAVQKSDTPVNVNGEAPRKDAVIGLANQMSSSVFLVIVTSVFTISYMY